MIRRVIYSVVLSKRVSGVKILRFESFIQFQGMPEFSGKQNPGTENFQTERSRTGKFWDQKIPGIPFFPGIREIFF